MGYGFELTPGMKWRHNLTAVAGIEPWGYD